MYCWYYHCWSDRLNFLSFFHVFSCIIIVRLSCFLSVHFLLSPWLYKASNVVDSQWICSSQNGQKWVKSVQADVFLNWCRCSASSCALCWSWYTFIGYGKRLGELILPQMVLHQSRTVGLSAKCVWLALQKSFYIGNSTYIWKIVLPTLHCTKKFFSTV